MILFYILGIIYSTQAFIKPEVNLKVTDIYECENINNRLQLQDYDLTNVDSDGFKQFTGKFNIPFDINDQFKYSMRVDKMKNGDWQSDVYTRDGLICDDLPYYFPQVWKKIKEKFNPPLTEECGARKGTYELKEFEVLKDEYDLPGILYGGIRVNVKVFNSNGEEVFCGFLEATA